VKEDIALVLTLMAIAFACGFWLAIEMHAIDPPCLMNDPPCEVSRR
jgi:hypothetical protein